MAEATLCARVIVEELLNRGVRHVVLAPGSRSAPLAYELYEADKIGLLTLHVRIDERQNEYFSPKAEVVAVPSHHHSSSTGSSSSRHSGSHHSASKHRSPSPRPVGIHRLLSVASPAVP